MIIESVHVPAARRVNSILLTLILLLFPVKVMPQGVTNSLKPVISGCKSSGLLILPVHFLHS